MYHSVGRPRHAVITAVGVAAPGALDPESFWRMVRMGKTAIGRLRRMEIFESGCSFGGEVPPFDLAVLPADLKPRRLARHTQLALWAARQIKPHVQGLPKNPFVRLGVATSCASMISESGIHRSRMGAQAASRHMVSQCPPHAASGAIAHYFETSASVMTISTGCAAGLDAIGLAAKEIVSGAADYVIAGGTDCAIGLSPLTEFVNSGLSSTRNSCPERASRPFDVFADSGVCSEGASLLLIEEKSCAEARGATILAEIAGYASCLDHDRSVPGSGWRACIQGALDNAGWTPEMIDSISAWGPGHPVIDRIEAEALEEVLGSHSTHVPVYSIKGVIGNPMAAAGPLQVAAALFSFRDGVVPPTANLEVPIPEVSLDFVRGEVRHSLPTNALLNAHGVGGANATLLLKAPQPNRACLRQGKFHLHPNKCLIDHTLISKL
ncbi:MAG TPA: beta-ketoacyl-[acyl-carrier-protein] synthase family protein [Terrimicrobiaceae bacterium]